MWLIQVIVPPVNKTYIIIVFIHPQGYVGVVCGILIHQGKQERAGIYQKAEKACEIGSYIICTSLR